MTKMELIKSRIDKNLTRMRVYNAVCKLASDVRLRSVEQWADIRWRESASAVFTLTKLQINIKQKETDKGS